MKVLGYFVIGLIVLSFTVGPVFAESVSSEISAVDVAG